MKFVFILVTALLFLTACSIDQQPQDMQKEYISQDLEQCKVIDYGCQEGYEPFTDTIGCGCSPRLA